MSQQGYHAGYGGPSYSGGYSVQPPPGHYGNSHVQHGGGGGPQGYAGGHHHNNASYGGPNPSQQQPGVGGGNNAYGGNVHSGGQSSGGHHNSYAQSAVAQVSRAPPSTQSSGRLQQLIADLYNPALREAAIQELGRNRDSDPNLGAYLWHSTGIVAILLQEVVAAYPLLNPFVLSLSAASRVSNTLTVLQCVASHELTRPRFIDAQLVSFLMPFLSHSNGSKAMECVRLTALGVVGGLVKNDDRSVIEALLGMEIVPVCLRVMEEGQELCKTLAAFVIQKILADEAGLEYMCQTPARFTAVATVLKAIISKDSKEPLTARLFRLVLRCYTAFTGNAKAKDALKQCMPSEIRDGTHTHLIDADGNVKKSYMELLRAIDDPGVKQ